MSKAWWLTPNEKRAVMSFGTDEENEILNEYYIPANLIPASGSDIEIEEPQPALQINEDEEKNNVGNTEIKKDVKPKDF